MGGKKKEAQRTKGNLKPASSGHAAQLLEASGTFQTGFVGFDSLSGDLGYVPANLQASEAAECGDGELRMVMKRLTKRDAVTKLKALQNFSEMCQEREGEVVTDALKYWPRLYSKLAIDYDHRVREAAHHALKEVAVRSGRNLAPHLKHLIGAWMLSFCDSHAPAASAARSAFYSVFSTEVKRSEALVYCHEELLKFLSEMLFTATAQSLSDARTTPAEEMQEKYERVLSSSLLCLRLVIKMCPPDKMADLSRKCVPVLDRAAFWKFPSHSNRTVKASFFGLIGCLVQHMSELANDNAAKICAGVLSRLGETDPVVCPAMWDAVERIVSKIEKFWEHVNLRKAMLPSLWSAMKKGFDGSAAVAAAKLPVLLQHLPADATGSSREFYSIFFTNLRAGMSADRVQRSMKELNSLVSSYHACLSLVLDKCVQEDDLSLLEELLDNQLLTLIEESLISPSAVFSKSSLYRELAKFVTGLRRGAEKKGASAREVECYGCARDLCWERLKIFSGLCIRADKSDSMNRFISLLKCLILVENIAEDSTPAGSRTVGFADTKRPDAAAERQHALKQTKSRIADAHLELERTMELVASVCVACIDDDSAQHNVLGHAILLCQLCGSARFYTLLAELLDGSAPGRVIDVCLSVLSKRAADWLNISTLIVMVTEYVSEEQSLKTLIKLVQSLSWRNMSDLLSIALSADWLAGCLGAWLADEKVQEHVADMKSSLEAALEADDETAVSGGLSFVRQLLSVIKQEEGFLVVCSDIQICLYTKLSATRRGKLFIECCEGVKMMIERGISADLPLLVRSLLSWLCDPANGTQDSGDEAASAVELFTYVLREHLEDMSCVISSLTRELKLTVSNVDRLTAISHTFQRIASSLPDNFIDLFSSVVYHNIDESQLLKWLSIAAIKGRLIAEEEACYINYTHASCPQFLVHTLFVSAYLTNTHQDITSISSSVHGYIAAAHTWLLYILENALLSTEVDLLTSSQTRASLETWLVDTDKNRSTCIDLLHTSQTVLSNLAVQCLASRLPEDCTAILMSQATVYLSAFETLTQAEHACLNTISYHLTSSDAADILELVAARIISTRPDDVDTSCAGLTGLLHIFTSLLGRLEEGDINAQVVLGVLNFTEDVKAQSPHQFISERHPYMATVDGGRLSFNVTLMRYFGQVTVKCSQLLSVKHWDLLLCSLDSWIGEETCMLSMKLTSYHDQQYTANVTSLLSIVGNLMKHNVTKQPANYPPDFLSEWAELHALSIYNMLIPHYVYIAGSITKTTVTVQQNFVLGCLSNALTHCPAACIKGHKLDIKLVPDATPTLPTNQETALNHLVPLLLSPCAAVQSASYVLLTHLIPSLPEYDKQPLEDDGEGRCPPVTLMSMIDHCMAGQLLFVVGGARVGVDKPLQLLAHTDELCCVRAFLLSWRLLLRYLQYSTTEQLAEYSYHLKQNHYAADLLLLLFNIIPLELPLPNNDTFTFTFLLDLAEVCDGDEAITLACSVYYNLIKVLPAMVRNWCTDLEKRANVLLDRFTAKYVSPRLCSDEMDLIVMGSALTTAENLNVRVRPTLREILATYTLEEFSIVLLIVLPSNYPVGAATVECSKKLGVATNEWRRWMLQLTTFLTYQNGSVANAISLWKKNLDKKFAGVEECYICFSVLHGTNLQMPKQQCKTCKKKFHSACLYKWFTSSQKSTCPLCRNLF